MTRNVELAFDDISKLILKKSLGQCFELEYEKDGKEEKFQYSVAQDWVKYPAKRAHKIHESRLGTFCAIY